MKSYLFLILNCMPKVLCLNSQDNLICIMSILQFGRTGVQMPGRARDLFSFPKCPNRPWGLTSLLFTGYWHSFPDVMQKEHEVNHSPLSSAEVKNQQNYLCTPKCLHSRQEDKFTCTLLFFFLTTDVPQKYSLLEIYFLLILDWKARVQFPVRCTGIFSTLFCPE